jgi:hypothetical protein
LLMVVIYDLPLNHVGGFISFICLFYVYVFSGFDRRYSVTFARVLAISVV